MTYLGARACIRVAQICQAIVKAALWITRLVFDGTFGWVRDKAIDATSRFLNQKAHGR